jgi:hypothetical protein
MVKPLSDELLAPAETVVAAALGDAPDDRGRAS